MYATNMHLTCAPGLAPAGGTANLTNQPLCDIRKVSNSHEQGQECR
jgi:hypothetical protein